MTDTTPKYRRELTLQYLAMAGGSVALARARIEQAQSVALTPEENFMADSSFGWQAIDRMLDVVEEFIITARQHEIDSGEPDPS